MSDDSRVPSGIETETRKPRLLLLVSGLGVGGAERLVIQLAVGMKKSGWSVVVVGLESDQELLDFLPLEGLDIRVMNTKRTARSFVNTVWAVIRLVNREKIELVHAHLFHSLVVGLLLRLLKPSVRLVFTSHNYSGFSPLRKALVRVTRIFRHGDVLFGVDQHPDLNASYRVIIPNGVDVPDKPPARNLPTANAAKRLLYLGRLTPEKNVDQIIKALALLAKPVTENHRDQPEGTTPHLLELWIAGDGPESDRLKALCRELGVESIVRFLGMRRDIDILLKNCYLLVMASSWEGLPMVVLEAGSAATPVVATPVGRLPAILRDDCGFLTSPGNLLDTLADALSQPELCQTYGHNLYQRVKAEYSMRSCIERHTKLYKTVLLA